MGTNTLPTRTKIALLITPIVCSVTLFALNPLWVGAAIPETPAENFSFIASGGVYATAISSDGTLYVGGYFTLVDDTELPGDRTLVRILPDGQVDSNFDISIDNEVRTLEVSDDGGSLFVGGQFNSAIGTNGTFDRYNAAAFSTATGEVTAFDPHPWGVVNDLELNAAGTLVYAAGEFTSVNNLSFVTRRGVAAFSASTGTVTSFDPNLATRAFALALDEDSNTLYAGGQFVTVNGSTARRRLAAFNTSTGTATSFNPNIDSAVATPSSNNIVYALQYDEDSDLLYAGGSFTTVNGGTVRNRLAAFDTATGTATSFDPNLSARVEDMALDTNEQVLYASGSFTTVNGGNTRNGLAAFDTTNATATSFDPNPDSPVYALSVDSLRQALYVGGDFAQISGVTRHGLAIYQNPDIDNDGITNATENSAPNGGDGNNDGTPDAEQAHVTSILNPDSNQYVTVVTPDGTTIETTTTEAAPAEDGYTHLFGLTGFTVSGVTPGDTIEISLFYPNPDNLDPTTLTPKKYFPSTTSYQDLPTTAPTNTVITSLTIDSEPTIQLSYNLTDGGDFDLDETADGQITDPVSLASTNPAAEVENPNTTDLAAGSLADTGSELISLHVSIVVLFGLGALIFATYRRGVM